MADNIMLKKIDNRMIHSESSRDVDMDGMVPFVEMKVVVNEARTTATILNLLIMISMIFWSFKHLIPT